MNTTKRIWFAVYLHNSPEPNRIFKTENEAKQWGLARDNKCVVKTCNVEAQRIEKETK